MVCLCLIDAVRKGPCGVDVLRLTSTYLSSYANGAKMANDAHSNEVTTVTSNTVSAVQQCTLPIKSQQRYA